MKRRLLLTVLVLALFAGVTITGTYAAFSNASANTGNHMTAGSVSVSDGHTAATAISITTLRPGTTVSNCINVTYDGDVAAGLRQYMSTSGTLVPYLNLKVTRGSGLSAGWPSCTGFTADSTTYAAATGVIYNGALSSFPTSAGTATLDPTTASPETWSPGESHAYQYDISVTNTAAAQGLTGSTTITWEVRNQ
ncbi:MAG: hypothetical protein QOJ12_2495 [Thermoleophilales bacterium]|jgi:hypothetical protein|nr:hypothetical protein [Thermoleophilales bacterium]